MKKRIFIIICIIFAVFANFLSVQASNEGTNMRLTLPEDYINLTQLVQQNNPILNQYQIDAKQQLENYQKNGIVVDAINQEGTKTITIFMLKNKATQQITDFKQLQDTELTQFMEEYKQEKQKDGTQIIRQRRYVIGEYIYINTTTKDEQEKITEEYYTIIDSTAISIILKCTNGEMPTDDMRNIVNTITFINGTSTVSTKTLIIITIFFILAIFVILAHEILKRKNKIEPNKDNPKLIKRVIQRYHLENYNKMGGVLLIFLITVLFSILNIAYILTNFFTHHPMIGMSYQGIYNIVVMIQNILQAIALIYIVIILRKRERKIKQTIQKVLLIVLGITMIGTIARVILVVLTQGITENLYLAEIGNGLKNVMYLTIWYLYYQNAVRVAIYYQQEKIEDLVVAPKKKIQKEIMNIRMIETQIICFFEEKKAIDVESALEISQIPAEYVKNFYFSRLIRRNYLKVKHNKVYVNQKANSTKYERIRDIKLIGLFLVLYMIILLLIEGM